MFLQFVFRSQCRRSWDAGDAAASLNKNFWEKFVRFGQIWLDLRKIKAKFGQIEAKLGQK